MSQLQQPMWSICWASASSDSFRLSISSVCLQLGDVDAAADQADRLARRVAQATPRVSIQRYGAIPVPRPMLDLQLRGLAEHR